MNTSTFAQLSPGPQLNPTAKFAVLEYRSERLVSRLMERLKLDREQAEILFRDMLIFLSLTDNGIKLAPSEKIDFAWHEFILHTRDYAEFCRAYFGHFIHHDPRSWDGHAQAKMDVAETARFAESVYGKLSPNWKVGRFSQTTCGSGGC